jgi:hypothetical protein
LRLAVLADIHGNGEALRAVLADLDACGGADRLLVLGDIVLLGPDPGEVVESLLDRDAVGVSGNTDRFLLATDWRACEPKNEEERADRALCLRRKTIDQSRRCGVPSGPGWGRPVCATHLGEGSARGFPSRSLRRRGDHWAAAGSAASLPSVDRGNAAARRSRPADDVRVKRCAGKRLLPRLYLHNLSRCPPGLLIRRGWCTIGMQGRREEVTYGAGAHTACHLSKRYYAPL